MAWWDDAVDDEYTLADYGTPPDAIVLEGPLHAESRRGEIGREWWGRQWVQVMERLGLDGRLERGKRYARNGSVLQLEMSSGMVFATVRGSRRKPYRTAITLHTLDEKQWRQALSALAAQAIYAAKLLAGEMPSDIETVFQDAGLSLFPQQKKDISFVCSCPDWGDPCKHAAALYYLVAEQLDADPFLLFHLRGRSRAAVLQALQGAAVAPVADVAPGAASDNFPLTVPGFWEMGNVLPAAPMPPENGPPMALQQLGSPPALPEAELRALYAAVTRAATSRFELQ